MNIDQFKKGRKKKLEDKFYSFFDGLAAVDGPRVYHKYDEIEAFLDETIDLLAAEMKVTGATSDGYHTFNELYEFRKVYNAVLFNEWSRQSKYNIHKSIKHDDGELCFGGGWFIVMATLPTGQISNHYELKDWDLFECEARDRADKWDGHTAQDVVKRLLSLKRKETHEEK